MELKIKGEQINLRKLRKSDAPSIYQNANNKSIAKYTTLPHPYKLDGAYGFIRKRNDKMLELTFSRHQDIYHLLTSIKPFLLIKKDQANLALSILSDLKKIQNADDFINVVKKVDLFQKLNFSFNRKINAAVVGNHLRNKGILTP